MSIDTTQSETPIGENEIIAFKELLSVGESLKARGCIVPGKEYETLLTIAQWAERTFGKVKCEAAAIVPPSAP